MSSIQEPQVSIDQEISLLDILLIAAENLRLLILVPCAFAILTISYLSLTTETTYKAKTTLLGPTVDSGAGMGIGMIMAQMTGLGGFGASGLGTFDQKIMAYLGSRELATKLVKKVGNSKILGAGSDEEAIKILGMITTVTQNKKTQLLEISVSHSNPTIAADLANGYVTELQSLLLAEDMANSKGRIETLDKMITEVTNRPHRVEVGRQLLQGLLQQYESAKLSAAGAGVSGRVTVVDIAVTPSEPESKGRLKAGVIAYLVTLVILLLFLFARFAVKASGENAQSARKLFSIRAAIRRAVTWNK
jgi:uncharacterized protein involved in exopolysaccharide biosynthesis